MFIAWDRQGRETLGPIPNETALVHESTTGMHWLTVHKDPEWAAREWETEASVELGPLDRTLKLDFLHLSLHTGMETKVRQVYHPPEPECRVQPWLPRAPAHEWHTVHPNADVPGPEAVPGQPDGLRLACCAHCGRMRQTINEALGSEGMAVRYGPATGPSRAWMESLAREPDASTAPLPQEGPIPSALGPFM